MRLRLPSACSTFKVYISLIWNPWRKTAISPETRQAACFVDDLINVPIIGSIRCEYRELVPAEYMQIRIIVKGESSQICDGDVIIVKQQNTVIYGRCPGG